MSEAYAIFHELNKAVAQILQKSGYKKEGELKNTHLINGEYYSDIIYAILNSN